MSILVISVAKHVRTQAYLITSPSHEVDDDPYIIADPSIARYQPAAPIIRLVPYFNGRFHVEEIMYREAIPWKDVKVILRRYKEHLIQQVI